VDNSDPLQSGPDHDDSTEKAESADDVNPPEHVFSPSPEGPTKEAVPGESQRLSYSVASPGPDPNGPFPQDFGPRYRLQKLLGGGGMGKVFLALDLTLDHLVALKVPHPRIIARPRMMERFHREARYAARLVHPGLAWVTDLGQVDGTHYLVMRYVEGTPLADCSGLSPREIATLVREVALAMAAAHRENVIHRDLKPNNIVVTTEGYPVVIDFGLALRLDDDATRLSTTDQRPGTRYFMAPEQLSGDPAKLGPKVDIYALGIVLRELIQATTSGPPVPDDPALAAIYARASAHLPEDRYAGMSEFAADLDLYLSQWKGRSPARQPIRGRVAGIGGKANLVHYDAIRFVFTGAGSSAPVAGPGPDRLYLDVGNDLRRGVIDHHHLYAYGGSTTRLTFSNPDLVASIVEPERDPSAPFTIVLHEAPDFDSVASAYLAVALLTTGDFPPGAEALARYSDKIDEGSFGHSLSQPFAPYAAYMQLLNRHARLGRQPDHLFWQDCVRQGLDLVAYALDRSQREGVALRFVDAFDCPELFNTDDRREVLADAERYHRKLVDPATGARVIQLSLPGQFGGRIEVDVLLVCDVQNADDPERSIFFKDWARSDRERSPGGMGFSGLSVFMSESLCEPRRCIISVTPDSGASIRGLAEHLDRAESEKRRKVYGEDDRVIDPPTGIRKPPRAGYDNADPWYDGRAHGFTIVDAPQKGTLLSANEIEAIFLKFGRVTEK
jgi:serine/threonine protein kinase